MPDDFEMDDEFRQFVEERLGVPFDQDGNPPDLPEEPEPDEETPPVPDTDEPDEEPDEAPEQPSEEPESPSDVTLAPGVTIPQNVALSYAQFDALLKNDPELFRLISETVQGRATGAQPQPTQAPAPSLPEINESELYDDTTRALYEYAKTQQQRVNELDARLKQVSDITINREQEELQSLIRTTRSSFQSAHELNDVQMDQVQAVAERLNVVPSLMRGVDPITGTASPRDRTVALNRAFDIAYNFIPEFRDKAINEAVSARAKSTRRKQRLAGISGTGGSMPKTEPVPTTERERRDAMIREVAEAMGEHRPE